MRTILVLVVMACLLCGYYFYAYYYRSKPVIACDHCDSADSFGYAGATFIIDKYSVLAPLLGYDRVWVVNATTGKKVLVDVDAVYGGDNLIPDFKKVKVNTVGADVLESTMVVPIPFAYLGVTPPQGKK